MPQFKAERPTFSFSKGLHSDASFANFPENYSVDELNFELLKDGTRRRRRGLEAESDALLDDDQPTEAPVRTFKWRSVAGNPDLNFHCVQIGSIVYFVDDVPEPSEAVRSFTLDLTSLAVEGHTADVGDDLVDMAFGRGHAIVVGKYIEPTYVVYDEATDDISATKIDIRERDFQGVEDGYDNQSAPVTASDEYLYNLANQGWDLGDAETYKTSKSKYPSKNMIPWLGFRREVVAGFNPEDGTRQFSPDKLINELFQDAPAPRGHFVINPFDTNMVLEVDSNATKNYVGGGWAPGSDDGFLPNSPNDMNLPSEANPTTTTLITATFQNPHFLDPGDTVDLYTQNLGKIGSNSGDGNRWWGIGGEANGQNPTHIVESVIDDNTITFYLTLQNDSAGWRNNWPYSYYPNVYAYVGGDVLEIDGNVIDERPTCAAFFAGRAIYAGIPHPKLGANIYISQVIEVDAQYGKCYQVADPTSENISDIIPTDGLVLRIPESGRIYALMPHGSSLIVYASGGVWQVGPGASGYFTAVSYSVRKISDAQCVNATSVILAEETPVFWASSGIFVIIQDPNSGFLISRSITEGILDTFYANLGEAARKTATGDFDSVQKRIVWIYGRTNALLYDLKFQAFTPWRFGVPVYDIFTTTDINASESTLRFIINPEFEIESISFDVTIGNNGSTAYGYDAYSSGPGSPDFGQIDPTPASVDGAVIYTIEGFSNGAGFEMFILEDLLPPQYTTLRVETSSGTVDLDLQNPDDGYLDPDESWYYWEDTVWGVTDNTQIRTITFLAGEPSSGGYQIATASSLDFTDFDVATEAYIVTGYDTAQSAARRKQAPVITVFMGRTEQMEQEEEEEPEPEDPEFENLSVLLQAHTGTLVEISGLPSVAVIGSGAVSSAQVKFGSASFRNPGTDTESTNYVRLQDATNGQNLFVFPGEFTIEGWFYLVDYNSDSYENLFANSIQFPNSGFTQLAVRNNGANHHLFWNSEPGQDTESAVPFPTGQWVFVAVTRDASGVVRLFQDGILVASRTITGPIGALNPTQSSLDVCRGHAADNSDADCYFDQIRMTKICRYTENFTPPTEPFPSS